MSEDGSLFAKEVKTEKITITVTEQTQSVGTGEISNGQATVTIQNALIKPNSKIFITWKTSLSTNWWISRQENGWFEVSVGSPVTGDSRFDYLLIGVEGTENPPPSPSPAPQEASPPPAESPTSPPAPVPSPEPPPEPSPSPEPETSPPPAPSPEPELEPTPLEPTPLESPPSSSLPEPPPPEPAP